MRGMIATDRPAGDSFPPAARYSPHSRPVAGRGRRNRASFRGITVAITQ